MTGVISYPQTTNVKWKKGIFLYSLSCYSTVSTFHYNCKCNNPFKASKWSR